MDIKLSKDKPSNCIHVPSATVPVFLIMLLGSIVLITWKIETIIVSAVVLRIYPVCLKGIRP